MSNPSVYFSISRSASTSADPNDVEQSFASLGNEIRPEKPSSSTIFPSGELNREVLEYPPTLNAVSGVPSAMIHEPNETNDARYATEAQVPQLHVFHSISNRRSGPSISQWEQRKAEITRLYRDEKRTLKDVMETMQNRGFRASTSMYKHRIEKWGLTGKNIKEKDARTIYRKTIQRAAEGKRTASRLNGQIVQWRQVMQHVTRKKGNWVLESAGPPMPPHIACRTPSPVRQFRCLNDEFSLHFGPSNLGFAVDYTEVCPDEDPVEDIRQESQTLFVHESLFPQSTDALWSNFVGGPKISPVLSTPTSLRIPEEFFYKVVTFQSDHVDEKEAQMRAVDGNQYVISPGLDIEFSQYCKIAINWYQKGSLPEFRRAFSKAFDLLQSLLQKPSPRTLYCVIRTIIEILCSGLEDVAFMMHRHIANLVAVSSRARTKSSPWVQTLQSFGILDRSSFKEVLVQSWACIINRSARILGPISDLTLYCRLDYIRTVYSGKNDAEVREALLRSLLCDCDDRITPCSEQQIRIMLELGWSLLAQDRNLEAETLGHDILSRVRTLLDASSNIRGLALIFITCCQYRMNKRKLAQEHRKDAMDTIGSVFGNSHPLSIRYMSFLENWMREWGEEEEANELKAQASELIGLDMSDLDHEK